MRVFHRENFYIGTVNKAGMVDGLFLCEKENYERGGYKRSASSSGALRIYWMEMRSCVVKRCAPASLKDANRCDEKFTVFTIR